MPLSASEGDVGFGAHRKVTFVTSVCRSSPAVWLHGVDFVDVGVGGGACERQRLSRARVVMSPMVLILWQVPLPVVVLQQAGVLRLLQSKR